jgi:hypothetical protein
MTTMGKAQRRHGQRLLVLAVLTMIGSSSVAFTTRYPTIVFHGIRTSSSSLAMSDEWSGDKGNRGEDSNQWRSMDEVYEDQEDWQDIMARKKDGSFWSDFEPSEEKDDEAVGSADVVEEAEEVDEADAWLDTLASLAAEEVNFNILEADRADKVRQMQEWGFDDTSISNTFGVAVDDTLEKEEVEGMKAFRDESYLEDEDWKKVESHTKVDKDPDTGDPVRQQMVGWMN